MTAADARTAGRNDIDATTVTVVIVNYNSGPWLGRALRGLARQSVQGFATLVIDNASTDASADICAAFDRVELIRSDTNLGFASANNRAVERASTEWIVLLNPDAIPLRRWLERLLAEAQRRPDYAIFGCTQLCAHDRHRFDGTGDEVSALGVAWRKRYLERRERIPSGPVFSVCGAALMIRRRDFLALGGFDERFFCYAEDVDLCFRANLRGLRCWHVADACVLHASSTSTSHGVHPFAIYHGYRNLLWTYIKNMPSALLPLPLLGHASLTLLKALLAGDSAARIAYLRALYDAWRGSGPFWRSRAAERAHHTLPVSKLVRQLHWNPLDIPGRRPWRTARRQPPGAA
ncbi:glycosyltransferase family 2 protein [Fontimonas thermophila]|nr:glycosyltransferase family 2 protein [Fontimonas thermophila]